MAICLLSRLRGPARLFPVLAYQLVSLENLRLDVRVNDGSEVQLRLDKDGDPRIF